MRILHLVAPVCLLALSACATQAGANLALSPEGDPAAVDQAFAAAVAQRLALRRSLDDVRADLGRAGFTCETVAPVEARLPYLAAVCRRTVARPQGAAVFTVRLETADGATLARAIGGFTPPRADDRGSDASDRVRPPGAPWRGQA